MLDLFLKCQSCRLQTPRLLFLFTIQVFNNWWCWYGLLAITHLFVQSKIQKDSEDAGEHLISSSWSHQEPWQEQWYANIPPSLPFFYQLYSIINLISIQETSLGMLTFERAKGHRLYNCIRFYSRGYEIKQSLIHSSFQNFPSNRGTTKQQPQVSISKD